MKEKIIIAGGTGFLGKSIIRRFNNSTTQIIVLTRGPAAVEDNVRYVNWDAKTLDNWAGELEGAKAIINLAGKSVNCRYTRKNKNEIIRSRVNATYIIGKAIESLKIPPKVWINASSAAMFGNSDTETKNEISSPGNNFSAEVCKKWEAAFDNSQTPLTRKIVLRIGVVLQKQTGLLQPFERLVKLGFGGKIGTGKQYISWIHEADFLNVIEGSLKNEKYNGIINCSSPQPVTNSVFMQALRDVLKPKIVLSNIACFVYIGALIIGTEAELVLKGRRVVSEKLDKYNFRFRYIDIKEAFKNLYNQ
ncbi:TIGR01777 family protein [Niabella ginsenosidivorans]|uniref:TIGR01777 family protein n=1 Tax=Niabella ginsenosidivorans TaxID=1176587 RepID=A0A1A9I1N0_9BACT|nr:TIGR01777 family oxidoreductase [Niabella ginsenosidivorans]ANH81433.1 TIGR01777 family protein [Niabella ginsenosidivorans]